jgi:PAS domain S-box-containing protein
MFDTPGPPMNDADKTKQQLIEELAAARAQREQLEIALRSREGDDERALETAACILWRARVVDVSGQLDWTTHVLNPKAAERLLPLDLAPGQQWETASLTPPSPEQGADQEAASEEAIRSGVDRYGQEVAYLDMYGSARWFYEDVSVRIAGPGQWELVGVSTDITERKGRERELQLAEEQRDALRAVLACAADGIIVVDAEGGFVEFNAAAEKILGIGATGVSPARWAEAYGIYHADGTTPVPADENPTVRALGGEHVDDWRGVIRNARRPDGVRIAVSARPLVTDGGRVEGAVATFQDITERDRVAEALADASTELARKELHLRRPSDWPP